MDKRVIFAVAGSGKTLFAADTSVKRGPADADRDLHRK